jgi:hypothetical protein
MAVKKFAIACYDDEAPLFDAVHKVRHSGYKLHDVYTPFPVHGLDTAMGLKETDLHIAGFIFGITGTSTALGFMSWIFTSDWPINYGGKPFFSLPAMIPITFELTVLFAAVGMVLTYCYLNQIMPGLFVVAIEVTEGTDEAELMNFLNSTNPVETDVQIAEEGWWFGRFDKEEDYTKHFAS